MEIFKLLDEIEDLIEGSSGIPFASKVLVDKNELLEILREIRIKLPQEIEEAEKIQEERKRILAEAQNEADMMFEEAKVHIEGVVDRHELVRQAEARAEEIITRAQTSAKEIRIGANEYTDDLLKGIEQHLKGLEDTIKGTIRTVELNRQELHGPR